MAKVRVHELAKEFGVESRVILEKLAEMGEFVKSASSTVEPSLVKRFTARYVDELSNMPYTPPMPDGWYDERPARPNPFSVQQRDPKLAEAAAVLGVPVHQLKPAQQQRPRPRRREQPKKPLSSWDRNFFGRQEREMWQRAGLGSDDGDLAARLVMEGITAADLRLPIRGMRAVSRLRSGESQAMVIRELLAVKRNQAG